MKISYLPQANIDKQKWNRCINTVANGLVHAFGKDPDGRPSGASHLMIERFIKEHGGENLTLDFEASNISSVVFFYKSFGSVLEKYPGTKMNQLPANAKLFRQ